MTRDELWLLKEKYLGEKTEGFFTDCERLKAHEPLAYVIGQVPFLNTTIYLDSHPLIPRTETEFWLERVIKEIEKNLIVDNPNRRGLTPTINPRGGPTSANMDRDELPVRILDLCAGSGCIGVAILKAIPTATVDFVEIDGRHHTTILKNIRENNIGESRTKIFGGNLFEQITEQYDYILTNPPYIDPQIDRAEASVKKHEPAIALYGGKDGSELIFNIIETTPTFLNKNGTLVVEHEPEQTDAITRKAHEVGFAGDTYPDQYSIERYTYFHRIHQ